MDDNDLILYVNKSKKSREILFFLIENKYSNLTLLSKFINSPAGNTFRIVKRLISEDLISYKNSKNKLYYITNKGRVLIKQYLKTEILNKDFSKEELKFLKNRKFLLNLKKIYYNSIENENNITLNLEKILDIQNEELKEFIYNCEKLNYLQVNDNGYIITDDGIRAVIKA